MLKPLSKLGFTVFPKDATKFFVEVVNEALDVRKQMTGEVGYAYYQLPYKPKYCIAMKVKY